MAHKAREWSTLDKKLIIPIKEAKEKQGLSLRSISESLSVSHVRVKLLFDQSSTPPTLDEYINLCFAVGLNPADVLRDAMRKLGM